MTEPVGGEGLTLDKRTMEFLVANIIPTSKYFEVRFDHMQSQIDDIKGDIKEFRGDVTVVSNRWIGALMKSNRTWTNALNRWTNALNR